MIKLDDSAVFYETNMCPTNFPRRKKCFLAKSFNNDFPDFNLKRVKPLSD